MVNWENKLLAFLHDPPHKPFQIAGHEDARESFLREVGLTLDDMRHHFVRMDDHMAAAENHLVFPDPETSGVKSDSPVEVLNPDPRGTADCGLRTADLIS
jgi:hypothetical protein